VSNARLSGLDASFLAVETPTAHMHVGWVARFQTPTGFPPPTFAALRAHIGSRLTHAPRYRQKLAPVPFAVHAPEWVDDAAFSVERHVYWAPGPLECLVDEVMSVPLRRDRPLWEIWVCHDSERQGFALVGKLHHCMVDGMAALELGSLLLDATPDAPGSELDDWGAAPEPRSELLLARALRDRAADGLDLLGSSARLLASPARAGQQTAAGAVRVARALGNALRPAPESALNAPLSPLRRLAWVERPFEDLRAVKRAFATTVNDVMLAAVAGGMRSYLMRRGEDPTALKAMIPVSVRASDELLGNRISFVFVGLPCDEPNPLRRLYSVHAAMGQRKRDGESEGADVALRAAQRTPALVQKAISRIVASPRTFNLTLSSIPGPLGPLFLMGSPLQAVYPVVPLSEHHALSIGMITVGDKACFGVYADREMLPDVDLLARDIDGALDELIARARTSPPRLFIRRSPPRDPPLAEIWTALSEQRARGESQSAS
jgi:WS/DGAT/MGAT family acyltransferase